MKKLFYIGTLSALLLAACGGQEEKLKEDKVVEASTDDVEVEKDTDIEELKNDPEHKMLLDRQQLLKDVISLIEEDDKQEQVFNPGDYIQGDIPKGEYAFIGIDEVEGKTYYYSEKDQNGNIVDNKNFNSFGYVYVHGVGNISTKGALFSVSALEKLNVSGAKNFFEILNEKTDYTDVGYYKVGVDIPAGSYVLESNGDGYVAVMTGPVGNSKIVTNKNFNGKYQVDVKDGQYLTFTKAVIKQ
ncbi:hypothetical protein [Lysinibacillus sp. RC79]|uniref:hypothetical protein n=1 Tax=Lysinibacillus sp. RC79 TaxID=3156296 RepID=UPI0035171BED